MRRPFAFLLLAWGLAGAGHAAAPQPQGAAGRPPDVLLITIDTWRADSAGFMGNRRGTTPNLDRLAAAGRVFTNAHAQAVVTLPSHTSILTGLYPYQHGVRDNTGFRVPATIPTLATVLRDAGYATAAFVGAYPLDSEFGLDRGFAVYDDHYPKGSSPEQFVMPERRGDQVVAPALAWWRAHRGERRFLWVHLYDPHAPYEPPAPFAERFRDAPYLGEVAAADAYLQPLLAPLLAGEEPPALVVVTGDHGEALGEHGEETHGLFAYEATLHVPLVVWGAGVVPGRDPRWARHVDIFPTVLAATGVKAPPAPAEVRPGLSLLAPPAAGEPSYFEALSTALNRGWAPLRGVLRDGRKLVWLPLPELYDLPRDPGETRNLVDAERREVAALRGLLPAESSWPPPRQSTSPEQAAALRSLGYVSGSAGGGLHFTPADDPKNLIGLDRKIFQLIDRYSRGQLAEAVRLGREIVAERPAMPIGHTLLAQALLQAGEREEAIAAMRAAQAKGVAEDSLLCQLGLTLAEEGQAAEAVAVLEPLTRLGDSRYWSAYGLALSEKGDQDAAGRALAQALKIDPENAVAYERSSLVALRRGDFAAARRAAERSVELNDALARGWNDLGVACWQLGDHDGALAAWTKAGERDASLADVWWNLGMKSLEVGRYESGRRALERFVAVAPVERYARDLAEAKRILRQFGGMP